MANDFNLKKFLTENKLTRNSKLLKETLENDDIIYDALLNMNHEQLVSDMLAKAESNPNLTLIDYLKKYNYSDN
jgi:hypothetical protein